MPRTTVVPLTLAAAVVLVLAGYSPSALDSQHTPGMWTGWSALGVLFAALLLSMAGSSLDVRRMVTRLAIVLVVGAVVLGYFAVRLLPAPERGLGVRAPLALLGYALVLVAAGLAFGLSRADAAGWATGLDGWRRLVVVAGVFVVVAALVAGVIAWTDGRNADGTEADGSPGRLGAPALTGAIAWRHRVDGLDRFGFDSTRWTTGGVLAKTNDGVVMLDPATGAQRWQYRRHDVDRVPLSAVSTDGGTVAFAAHTRANRPFGGQGEDLVWVLDAVTGRLRGSFDLPDVDDHDRLDLAGGRLLVSTQDRVTAYGYDGTPAWSTVAGCPGGVADLGGASLLCATGTHVERRSGADGHVEWTWAGTGSASAELPDTPVRDTAFVLQPGNTTNGSGTTVTAVDTATGTTRWHTKDPIPMPANDKYTPAQVTYRLTMAGTVPVLLRCRDPYADAAALDPATGHPTWRRDELGGCDDSLPNGWSETGLADGRTVALMAGRLTVLSPAGKITTGRLAVPADDVNPLRGMPQDAGTVFVVADSDTVLALR